ncbi:biogenesis of lysosome-related organelles complex 1 subunit 3 [Asbolus verrucosus]|uniref:Biogenesis of lysosome-related organelles complex 1 subunit 3 n=1 Tax=Asbolus verrucosus TaxID=1661398 RepID=A0A482W9D9_ASBVE|nr:biogenesis of lysosome-related organelles complex 1 subunit 3 [Asbolus verrucosus]
MNKPIIISGEASETESEDEAPKNAPLALTSSIQGAVVTGEDSESENENDASICSAVSALNETHSVDNAFKRDHCDKYDSLLHQKLRECNGKLHHDIECFCQNIVGEAGKSLTSIDQHLIKSQLTLQNAVTSLKSLSANSLAIKNKLQSLLSAQFIPNIKVDK